jgi:dihydrofolate reductase
MATVTVFNHMSLDGVMQAPARPDEDTRGGFRDGGWAFSRIDEVMGRVMGEGMASESALLLGRRTYEDFYAVWPNRPDEPASAALDRARKYVASRTLSAPLPWANSVLLEGDAVDAVAKLKREPGPNLTVLGSGELIGSLLDADLIDEYLLMIHPLVLGSGRRLFPQGVRAPLKLTNSVVTSTGVVIATYQRDATTSASTIHPLKAA